MRAMRLAMGRIDAPALTVVQFRTLHFIESHAGDSLSATADFLGLTLPSTSKLVEQLVRRGVLTREHHATDRRRMTLKLTGKGEQLLRKARAVAGEQLAATLEKFPATELAGLRNVLLLLHESFPSPAKSGIETPHSGIVAGTPRPPAAPVATNYSS